MTDRIDTLRELLAKVEAGGVVDATELPFEKALGMDWPNAITAYRGSLDAAKALDEAVLTSAVMDDETAKLILFGRNGSRIWLTWKIKALIAEVE